MQTVNNITLNVRGMHCGSCVARIRRALSGIDGIETATVDLGSGTVQIAGISLVPAELVDVLTEAGYAASIAHEAGRARDAHVDLPSIVDRAAVDHEANATREGRSLPDEAGRARAQAGES